MITMEELADQLDPEFPGPCYARLWRWRHAAAVMAERGLAPLTGPVARALTAPTSPGYPAPVGRDLERFLRALAAIREHDGIGHGPEPIIQRTICLAGIVHRTAEQTVFPSSVETANRWCMWRFTGPVTAPYYGIEFQWTPNDHDVVAILCHRPGTLLWSIIDARAAITWRAPNALVGS